MYMCAHLAISKIKERQLRPSLDFSLLESCGGSGQESAASVAERVPRSRGELRRGSGELRRAHAATAFRRASDPRRQLRWAYFKP